MQPHPSAGPEGAGPEGGPSKRAHRTAWVLWSATLVLVLLSTVFLFLDLAVFSAGDTLVVGLILLTAMVYASVGGLVGSRLPRNPIGWLLAGIGLALVIAECGTLYALRGLVVAPGSLPAPRTVASLGNTTQTFTVASLVLVVLLFPNGRPPSRRWWPVVWTAVAVDILGTVGFAIERGNVTGLTNSLSDAGVQFTSTIGLVGTHGVVSSVLAVVGVVGLLTGLASFAAPFLRRRRASADERQQLAWLGYVAATAVVLLVVLIPYGVATSGRDDSASTVLFVLLATDLFLGIPVACGIAVLRYRLYELDVIVKKTVVFGALVVLFTSVYVAVVVGIGAAVGTGGNAALTFAAAAAVALLFQPFRARATRMADRLVYGQRATPYEVLSTFAHRAGETYSTDDVLPRMAQILAAGTGARRAEVWLRVGGELRRAARWPPDEAGGGPEPDGGGETMPLAGDDLPPLVEVDGAFPVRHLNELLGALAVAMPANEPLVGSKEKLIQDLAAQAGLVLRNVRLIEELRASRQRLVTAQDEERRRLERNIHDGAQQQLVALAIKMRLVRSVVGKDAAKAEAMVGQAEQELAEAVDTLRELARGIYPPVLADLGLAEALRGQARKAPLPVEIDADGLGRYPQNAEAAVYFCCLEALQNVAKYAEATRAVVRLREEEDAVTFSVTDDGRGFDVAAGRSGTGVQGMADRLEALGGTLEVRSSPGHGTEVRGRLPMRSGRTSS